MVTSESCKTSGSDSRCIMIMFETFVRRLVLPHKCFLKLMNSVFFSQIVVEKTFKPRYNFVFLIDFSVERFEESVTSRSVLQVL